MTGHADRQHRLISARRAPLLVALLVALLSLQGLQAALLRTAMALPSSPWAQDICRAPIDHGQVPTPDDPGHRNACSLACQSACAVSSLLPSALVVALALSLSLVAGGLWSVIAASLRPMGGYRAPPVRAPPVFSR